MVLNPGPAQRLHTIGVPRSALAGCGRGRRCVRQATWKVASEDQRSDRRRASTRCEKGPVPWQPLFAFDQSRKGALPRMGVWGLLGVSFISFYITVSDSFLLRNERNPRNPGNPRVRPWSRNGSRRSGANAIESKIGPHQKGRKREDRSGVCRGVFEVL